MLSLAFPWALLLLPLPLLVMRIVPARAEDGGALRVPFFARLMALTGASPERGRVVAPRRPARLALLWLGWILALAALARPQWIEAPLRHQVPTRDLLLLVDLSGSMATEDFTTTDGRRVDRLTAVRQVLDGFLARRQGDRIGIVVFGDAPFVLVPFTTDLALCRRLLAETVVGMAGPRTALGDAIGLGITLFAQSKVTQRTMIALTDGNDTGSRVPPAEAAGVAHDRGIVIHTVAVGDPAAAGEDRLDEAALRAMAGTTGGGFYRALDRGQLDDIYRRLDAVETRRIETVSFRPRRDLYWLPLAALTILTMAVQGAALLRRRVS